MGMHGLCVVLAAMVSFSLSAVGYSQSPEEIEKIQAALPAKARVKPSKPRKLLVFNLALGYKHASIPVGAKAIEMMGLHTGAYETTVTDDVSWFEPERLNEFDAVLMNNNTGEFLTTPTIQQGLLDFVASGKGIAGIHAGSDCNFTWPEYGKLIGGFFDGHPWSAESTVTLHIEDPKNPVAAAFGGKSFTVVDEIYQFKDPYSRSNLRILASLDHEKTDMTKKGMKRADGDYPVSWIQKYGEGRVFYCSLGHNNHIYWNPVVLQHYLDGIQYALGDLEADATPRRENDRARMDGVMKSAVAAVLNSEFNQSRESLNRLDALVRHVDEDEGARKRLAKAMSSVLVRPPAKSSNTLAGRQWLCRRLADIGGAENVSDLASLLRSSEIEVVDMARYALERIPGEEASAALRKALDSADIKARTGLVGSIGKRRDGEAVEPLVALISKNDADNGGDDNASIAEASEISTSTPAAWHVVNPKKALNLAVLEALGQIGTREAVTALDRIMNKVGEEYRPVVADALLAAAGRVGDSGQQEYANAIYRDMAAPERPPYMRVPAFVALVQSTEADGRSLAVRELLGNDDVLVSAAAKLVIGMRDSDVTEALVSGLANAEPVKQQLVLEVLGYRGDNSAMAAVRDMVASDHENVRVAALRALSTLGNGTVVDLLAASAANGSANEKEAARGALASLHMRDVNNAILFSLGRLIREKSEDSEKVARELVRALGQRTAREGVSLLLRAAAEGSENVQADAFGVLSELASADDTERLAELLVNVESDKVRKQAEKAAVAAATRINDIAAQVAPFEKVFASTTTPEAKASILRVSGRIGTVEGLELLRKNLEDSNEIVKDASIRAIADFPTSAALEDARGLARKVENENLQVLAVRGFARMLGEAGKDMDTSASVAYAGEALEMAKRTEDKQTVIGEIAEIPEVGVLELIVPLLDDKDLRKEATAAAIKLSGKVYAQSPDFVSSTMEKVLAGEPDETQKKGATEVLEKLKSIGNNIPKWKVAGPYREAGRRHPAILDIPFAPEKPGAAVEEWKTVEVEGGDKVGMVDLQKIMEGNNRVAYLRARVWSPEEQKASLETGSDDGIKVWFNGRKVFTSKKQRPHRFGEDRTEVTLNSGWNTVMLKVSQSSGDWSASARILSTSGGKIKGLKFDTEETSDSHLFVETSKPAQ